MKLRCNQAATWTCPTCRVVLVVAFARGPSSLRPSWEGKPEAGGTGLGPAIYTRLALRRERHRQQGCGTSGKAVLKLLDGGLTPLSEEAFEHFIRDLEEGS
jgi:hypothetical protein